MNTLKTKTMTTADRLTAVAPTLRRQGYQVRKVPQRPQWSVTDVSGQTATIQYDTRAGFIISGTVDHQELHRLLGD